MRLRERVRSFLSARRSSIRNAHGVREYRQPPMATWSPSETSSAAAGRSTTFPGPAIDSAHPGGKPGPDLGQDVGGQRLHLLGRVVARDQAQVADARVDVSRELLGALLGRPADGVVRSGLA